MGVRASVRAFARLCVCGVVYVCLCRPGYLLFNLI